MRDLPVQVLLRRSEVENIFEGLHDLSAQVDHAGRNAEAAVAMQKHGR